METVLGNPGGVSPQEFVAPWRTVAADYGYLSIRLPRAVAKVRQKIEQVRIVMKLLAGAVVTQEVIQLGERVVEINIASSVDDVDVLAGMSMEQA